MAVGQPHLDGPHIPTDPVGIPVQVEVKLGETTNVDIQLIDLDVPPPDAGGDAEADPDAN